MERRLTIGRKMRSRMIVFSLTDAETQIDWAKVRF